MLISLSLIFLIGLLAGAICQSVKIPRIIGMLFTGILIGPFAMNWLDNSVLALSADLRQIALIIILLKAGFSLNIADLKAVGRPAFLMSFLPATCEIIAFYILAPSVLGVESDVALLMGSVLAAVSPAVVVPKMVELTEKGYGRDKSIPQLILASASCDDIFVIVVFTAFLSAAQGNSVNFSDFLDIPLSVINGIILGAAIGYLLHLLFETANEHKCIIKNSTKVIILLGVSFLLVGGESVLHEFVPMSGLLAVMSISVMIKLKSIPFVSGRLSEKFGKLWLAAEIVLFVLIGAEVDIRYTLSAGIASIAMIFISLIFRSMGVIVSTMGTRLNMKERLFCVIAYSPKATVQAAIGAVPLSLGIEGGNIILSVAVLAILITAPLGAFLIDISHKKLLTSPDSE